MKKFLVFLVILLIVIGGGAVWLYLDYEMDFGLFLDEIKAKQFTPTTEVEEIKNDLKLTRRGEAVFYAAQPGLLGKTEFNQACGANKEGAFTAGCYYGVVYADEHIAVYNVGTETKKENGIEFDFKKYREVVALHEMLHAVWERQGEETKTEACGNLKILEGGLEKLEKEMELYGEEGACTELFARVGSEYVAAMETNYKGAEIIVNTEEAAAEKKLVEIYEKYYDVKNVDLAGAYWDNQGKLGDFETKMTEYREEMDEQRVYAEELTAKYYATPTKENYEQAKAEVDKYNGMIDTYNGYVETYNEIYGKLDSGGSGEKLGV